MTWPAPTPTLPPPGDPATETPTETSDTSTDRAQLRDLLGAVTPAAWVATVGGALVLLAAAIVVVGNWDAIGRSVRVAGLVLGTVGLIATSERLRRVVPSTASIIAHVGTFLTATVGIAAMSLAGFTWPACLAVGGVVAIIATQLQMPRWPRGAFGAGQVAAIALAATGVGVLTGTTGGLLGGIAAIGLLAIGAHRRAAALALVAVCSPALAALAEAGIGAGTFERAGLVGERLSWSGPVVGVLAALVLGTIAMQRRNNGLMVTAAIAPLLGTVTGLAAIDGSAVAWLCLPGFAVIAAELTWWILPGDAMRRQIGGAIDSLAASLAVLSAILAPIVAFDFGDELEAGSTAVVPIMVTVLALALATVRWRSDNRRIADAGLAALAVLAFAIGIPLGLSGLGLAAAGVIVTIAAGWTSRSFGAIAVYGPAGWAVFAIVTAAPYGTDDARLGQFGLLAVLVGFAALVRARLAGDNRWSGPVELVSVVAIAAMVAAEIEHGQTALAAMIAIAGTSAAFMLAERRFVAWSAGVVAVGLAITAFGAAVWSDLDTLWIGALVATASFVGAWLLHREPIAAHVAAAGSLITGALASIAIGVDPDQFFVLSLVTTMTATGLALLTARATPLDTAAATAGGFMLLSSWATAHDAWVSIAWIAVGLQLLLIGAVRRQLLAAGIGGPTVAMGLFSLWFTSGWHDLLSGWLAPADIRVGDLWMAVATLAALAGGVVVRRRSSDTNSWLAFGPTLAIAAVWLLPVQAERATAWALPLALAIGMIAIGVGAAKRLAGPLVGGMLLTAASAFIALDSDLSAVPAWIWFGIGGLALLVAATAIERSSRDETSIRELVQRWQ